MFFELGLLSNKNKILLCVSALLNKSKKNFIRFSCKKLNLIKTY